MVKQDQDGFTLIELMVVLAVLAILAAIMTPNYLDRVAQAREAVLKHDLAGIRIAIDQYYRDKSKYPSSLAELASLRYIREVPEDPITRRKDSWILLPPVPAGTAAPQAGNVFDIKSGAPGQASDGTLYADW